MHHGARGAVPTAEPVANVLRNRHTCLQKRRSGMTCATESAMMRSLFRFDTSFSMSTSHRDPLLLTRLDGLSDIVGRSIAWLVLLMMLVQFAKIGRASCRERV